MNAYAWSWMKLSALSLVLGGCVAPGSISVSETGSESSDSETSQGSESSDSESSDSESSDSETDTDTDTDTDTTGELEEGFCEDACAVLAEGSCLELASCLDYCQAEAPTWTTEIGEAFEACASENPLCFESTEGCMFSQLHPPGTAHTVRFEGSGFDEQNGQELLVWSDPDGPDPFTDLAVISGGEFAFEWSSAFASFDTSGPLLLLYIDVDESGSCDPGTDLTASITPEWNGDYLDPQFEAIVMAPFTPADFVCDFLP